MSEVQDHGWEVRLHSAARPGFNQGLPLTMVLSRHKTREGAVRASTIYELSDRFNARTMTTTVEPVSPKEVQ